MTDDLQITIEAKDRERVATILAIAAAAIEGEVRLQLVHGDGAHRLWNQADRLYRLADAIRPERVRGEASVY